MSDTSDKPEFSAYELMKSGGRAVDPSDQLRSRQAQDERGDGASDGASGGELVEGSAASGPGGPAKSAAARKWEGDAKSVQKTNQNAWSRAKMAAFLRELAASQSVAGAARSVGMSRQSAYRLKNRLASTPFALGWEVALEAGFSQLAHAMMDRAINGVEVPHYYQGELIGTSRSYDERLAIWIANNPWKVGRQQVAREFSAEGFDRLMERIEHGPLDWEDDVLSGDGDDASDTIYIDALPGLEELPTTPIEAEAQQKHFIEQRSWYAALSRQEDAARGGQR